MTHGAVVWETASNFVTTRFFFREFVFQHGGCKKSRGAGGDRRGRESVGFPDERWLENFGLAEQRAEIMSGNCLVASKTRNRGRACVVSRRRRGGRGVGEVVWWRGERSGGEGRRQVVERGGSEGGEWWRGEEGVRLVRSEE